MTFVHQRDAAAIAEAAARRRWQTSLTHSVRFLLGTGLLCAAAYLAASAPAQFDRLRFAVQEIGETSESTPPGAETRVVPHNTLLVPGIGVEAPILWDVPLADALNGLQRGVVHARETAAPGTTGRTFIIGHSAGYWWTQNPWTKVFALLDQLNPGDAIYLDRDGTRFAYRVTRSFTVSPSKIDILTDGPNDQNQLALMTCTPVGTTLKRLVILADPLGS